MPNSLQGSFGKFIFERAFSIALDKGSIMDPERIKASENLNKITDNLKNLLGENFNLILDLDDATTTIFGIDIEYAYRQGLKDGVQLRQELGLVS
jgi:hypothetical protein